MWPRLTTTGPPGANNPVSPLTGERMVDAARIFLWAWDARPFPQFPARDEHVVGCRELRARALAERAGGALPLGPLVATSCRATGLPTSMPAVDGLVAGFLIDRVMSGRQALDGLMTAMASTRSRAAACCGCSCAAMRR